MYRKHFELRWSDIDSNLHLRNSAYIDYMSHTRMSYFSDRGFDQKKLFYMNLGPVVLYEHMYYFREAHPGDEVSVDIKLRGVSDDGVFFSFQHDFYNAKGQNLARCEMLGAWIDLKTRKLTKPAQELWVFLDEVPRSEDYKTLTKEDTRKHGQLPKDL